MLRVMEGAEAQKGREKAPARRTRRGRSCVRLRGAASLKEVIGCVEGLKGPREVDPNSGRFGKKEEGHQLESRTR